MNRRRLRAQDYTIGWICALPIELAAAQEMLDEVDERPILDSLDPILYTLGRINVHNVVLACLPAGNTGTQSAATVAARMRSKFTSIRFGLMVGIGGGVPSIELDIRLGDVVVSQPYMQHGGVVQYDFGKTEAGGNVTRTGWLNAPPPVLLHAIVEQRALHYRGRSNLSTYLATFDRLENFSRNTAGPDVLFEATYDHVGGATCEQCNNEMKVRRPARKGREVGIHYGTIASGNQVMKDGITRDKKSRELGGVMCFEMEAAGLMNDFPCLVIRGICDYADSHKNKKWQPCAAATAAACAKEILSIIPGIPGATVARTATVDETGQTKIEMKLDQLVKELRLGFKSPALFMQNLEKELVDDNITEVDVEENKDFINEWLKSTHDKGEFDDPGRVERRPGKVNENVIDAQSPQNYQGIPPKSNSTTPKPKQAYCEDYDDNEDDVSDYSDGPLPNAETEVPDDQPSVPSASRNAPSPKRRPDYVPRYVHPLAENERNRLKKPQHFSRGDAFGEDGVAAAASKDGPLRKARSRRDWSREQTEFDDTSPYRDFLKPSGHSSRRRPHSDQEDTGKPVPERSKSNPSFPSHQYHRPQAGPTYYRDEPGYAAKYDGDQPQRASDSYFYENAHPNHPSAPPSNIFSEFLKGGGEDFDFGGRPAPAPARAPAPEITIVEKLLPVSLEELFYGATKKMKITRKTYDPATGRTSPEDRILEVPITKGLRAGSKIKFSDVGDQVEGGTQDLHFIIQEVNGSTHILHTHH